MSSFDSIIIGGGPAGTSAGEMLAGTGLKTLILEKEEMPRYKCCAGGIPRKIAHLLDFDFSLLRGKEIKGIVFSWQSGRRRYLAGRQALGWVVKREIFDQVLLERAASAGAAVHQKENFKYLVQSGREIKVRTDRGEYRARTLIGADGACSRVSEQLNLSRFRRYGFALETRIAPGVQGLRDRGDYLYFDFGSIPRGYAWIFPHRDHLSVGVATRYRRFSKARRYLREYLKREGLLGKYPIGPIRGGVLAFNFFVRGVVRDKCLLAGDAAGLTDRLSGEGVYGAVKSGRLAARAIIDYLAGRAGLKNYRRMIWNNLGSELFLADCISRVEDLFPRWIYRRVFSNEDNARKAAAVVQGQLKYRDLIIEKLSRKLKIRKK